MKDDILNILKNNDKAMDVIEIQDALGLKDSKELEELIKYQREHGFKLMWVCQNGADHKALWEAMTR